MKTLTEIYMERYGRDDETDEQFTLLENTSEVVVSEVRKRYEWVKEQHALWLDDKPSEWSQGTWIQRAHTACGTVCCVAGKTLLDHGYEYGGPDYRYTLDFYDENGAIVSPARTAAGILGLNYMQAGLLFDGDNTFETVREVCSALVGEELL